MSDGTNNLDSCKRMREQLLREDPVNAKEVIPFLKEYEGKRLSSSSRRALIHAKRMDVIVRSISDSLPSISDDLQKLLENIRADIAVRRGHPSPLKRFTKGLSPELLVYMTVRGVVTLCDVPEDERTLQRAAKKIGDLVASELVMSKVRQNDYEDALILEDLDFKRKYGVTSEERRLSRKRYFRHIRDVVKKAEDVGNEARVDIGVRLLHMVSEITKLVTLRIVRVAKHKTITVVILGEELLRDLDKSDSVFQKIYLPNMPILCRPKRWGSLYGGGYYASSNGRCLLKIKSDNEITKQFVGVVHGLD